MARVTRAASSRARGIALGLFLFLGLAAAPPALAQGQTPPPPTVGVMRVTKHAVTESETFIGRIQAVQRYSAVARVTAFLEKVVFTEGQDVKRGDVLYQLEQAPFRADVDDKKGAVLNVQAQLKAADLALQRSTTLMQSPAGLQSKLDQDRAQVGSLQGQLASAQADQKTAEITLGYTTITSPIDGKVSRTAVTPGNLVTPESGVLTTVVSQDPMHVVFTIPTRTLLALRNRYAAKGGFQSVRLKLVLPDGRTYGQDGRLDFSDNTVSSTTDSVTLRGLVPNPPLRSDPSGSVPRELIDGEFVTVIFESSEPVFRISIPRSAVLTDQRGDYVYLLGAGNRAERRDIELGQPEGTNTTVQTGLSEGQTIVVDNLQRVRAGEPLTPTAAQSNLIEAARGAGR